jgi:ribosome-associated protein
MSPETCLERAASAALDKKASEVVVLDLREEASLTDYFLLASGANQRQVVAIADAILEALREAKRRPGHVEGYPRQEWILIDFGDFVVHVMTARSRGFYDLERLWAGAARREVAG